MEFKVGDCVRIRGDYSDYTDHLDGCLGTIVRVNLDDCLVQVDNVGWLIWKENLTRA